MEGYSVEFTVNDKGDVSGLVFHSPEGDLKAPRRNKIYLTPNPRQIGAGLLQERGLKQNISFSYPLWGQGGIAINLRS